MDHHHPLVPTYTFKDLLDLDLNAEDLDMSFLDEIKIEAANDASQNNEPPNQMSNWLTDASNTSKEGIISPGIQNMLNPDYGKVQDDVFIGQQQTSECGPTLGLVRTLATPKSPKSDENFNADNLITLRYESTNILSDKENVSTPRTSIYCPKKRSIVTSGEEYEEESPSTSFEGESAQKPQKRIRRNISEIPVQQLKQCEHCNNFSISDKDLWEHKRNICTVLNRGRKFACVTCLKLFKNRGILKGHRSGRGPKTCRGFVACVTGNCALTFRDYFDLYKHLFLDHREFLETQEGKDFEAKNPAEGILEMKRQWLEGETPEFHLVDQFNKCKIFSPNDRLIIEALSINDIEDKSANYCPTIKLNDSGMTRHFPTFCSAMYQTRVAETGAALIITPTAFKLRKTAEQLIALSLLELRGVKHFVEKSFQNDMIWVINEKETDSMFVENLGEFYWKASAGYKEMHSSALHDELKSWVTLSTERANITKIHGSAFDKLEGYWNLGNLQNDLNNAALTFTDDGSLIEAPGVRTPLLLGGKPGSFEPMRTPHQNFGSLSFHHAGGEKIWDIILPDDKNMFEEKMARALGEPLHNLQLIMKTKSVVVHPKLLQSWNVRYSRRVQRPGDYIWIAAGTYSQSYNLDYNLVETVCFVTKEVLPVSLTDKFCPSDFIKRDAWVKHHFPEIYQTYIKGKYTDPKSGRLWIPDAGVFKITNGDPKTNDFMLYMPLSSLMVGNFMQDLDEEMVKQAEAMAHLLTRSTRIKLEEKKRNENLNKSKAVTSKLMRDEDKPGTSNAVINGSLSIVDQTAIEKMVRKIQGMLDSVFYGEM